MHFQSILPALCLAAAATAATIPRADCSFATFKIVNPKYTDWAVGKYGIMHGDEPTFGTNDTTAAKVFSVDKSSGELWDGGSLAFWQGEIQGHDDAVQFQSRDFIEGTQGATVVHCNVPANEGDQLICSGDSSGKDVQWDMCYQGGGGAGLGLVVGNSTGPYPGPGPITWSLYCGGLIITVAELGCASAPAP